MSTDILSHPYRSLIPAEQTQRGRQDAWYSSRCLPDTALRIDSSGRLLHGHIIDKHVVGPPTSRSGWAITNDHPGYQILWSSRLVHTTRSLSKTRRTFFAGQKKSRLRSLMVRRWMFQEHVRHWLYRQSSFVASTYHTPTYLQTITTTERWRAISER
jgi:hypothetical protein